MSTIAAPVAPASEIDPFSDAVLADPYPAHEAWREAGPAVWIERYRVWVMARHEQVDSGLRDAETYCSSRGVGLTDFATETPWRPPSLLLEADPPEHTVARRTISSVITPQAVKAMRDTFAATAERMVAGLIGRGQVDGMADLAIPFPLAVMPDQVGLPAAGREHLLSYGSMVFNGFGPRNRHFEAAMAAGAAVRDWIAGCTRRENLAGDGLGARIHEAAEAEGFPVAERELIVRSVLSAGIDTTVHGIGNALYCLATHPEQFAALREDPSLARGAFEEVVRFESPVQIFFRTTTRPVTVDGVALPEGAKVLLYLAAGNRDPRRFPEPDRFDVRRKAGGHVAFGAGIHACVGRMIARLEGEVMLQTLATQVAELRLAGEPERMLNNSMRGLARLPLELAA